MVKLVVTAEWAFTEHGPYAWHTKHSPCLSSAILRGALGGSYCYPKLADEETESWIISLVTRPVLESNNMASTLGHLV